MPAKASLSLTPSQARKQLETLTGPQREIIYWQTSFKSLGRGDRTLAIADQLTLSIDAVYKRCSQVYKRLGVKGPGALIEIAEWAGLSWLRNSFFPTTASTHDPQEVRLLLTPIDPVGSHPKAPGDRQRNVRKWSG